jgi:hypothetical protein
MSRPDPNPPQQCPSCGATLAPEADHCWVCRWELQRGRTEGEASSGPVPPPADVPCAPHAPREGPSVQPHAEREEYIRDAPTPAEQAAPFQFGLSSLLLIMTLASVLFSVMAMAPGVGIVLAILAIPPLVRTWRVANHRQTQGHPLSARDRIGIFLAALGIAVGIGVAAGVAFFATCFMGFVAGSGISGIWAKGYDTLGWGVLTGGLFGLAAGGAAGYFLIRHLWPKGDQPLSK